MARRHDIKCTQQLAAAVTHQFVEDVQFLCLRQLAHVVVEEHGEHLGVEPLLLTAAHRGRLGQRHHAERRRDTQDAPTTHRRKTIVMLSQAGNFSSDRVSDTCHLVIIFSVLLLRL